MKKTKEECLGARGINAAYLGEFGTQIMLAMDDYATQTDQPSGPITERDVKNIVRKELEKAILTADGL